MPNLKSFKLSERKEYGRFYGDFRGVDFSTDHTQIDERRFAYLVNMWKNYYTDQGVGIETIPGFRRVYNAAIVDKNTDNTVYAIHTFDKVNTDGTVKKYALFHVGNRLHVWDFEQAINVKKHVMVTITETSQIPTGYRIQLPDYVGYVDSIEIFGGGEKIENNNKVLELSGNVLTYITNRDDLFIGQYVTVNYREKVLYPASSAAFTGMEPRKSASFTLNNRLYIIDGKNYLVFDGEKVEEVIVVSSHLVKHYSNWNDALTNMAGIKDRASAEAAFPVGTTIVADSAATEKATVIGYGSSFQDYPGMGNDFDPFSSTNVTSAGWVVLQEGADAFYSTAYVPTTYRFAVPSGVNADAGKEWEARNLLSPYFKMTFVGDGESTEYYLNETDLEAIVDVKVNGESVEYTSDIAKGMVTFTSPPKSSPEGSDNVVITAKKWWRGFDGGLNGNAATSKDMILGCTIATVFDSRVFFAGNPNYPNHVFWCGLNSTGYVDPTYFGAINYQLDGVGNSPVTGMVAVADSLMVLKRDAENGANVYYHTPQETGVDLITKIYPSKQGLGSAGCLGACTSFLDDPVFVSRLGLEAMGQLSVRYERAVEHRSHLIDSMLTKCDLSSAVMEEWGGYLFLLVDGKVFLADSRQKASHQSGHMQYEWYYLEDIGVWEGQYEEAVYASEIPLSLQKPDGSGIDIHYCTSCRRHVSRCENPYKHEDEGAHVTMPLLIADNVFDFDTYTYVDKRGKTANPRGSSPVQDVIKITDGEVTTVNYVDYVVQSGNAYLVTVAGNFIGGTFRKATSLKAIGDTVYFGTESGDICAFNFDKRNAHGEIPTDAYSFDERTIYCGCATKMDNCGVPHLTKNTVRKSLVVKTKAMGRYAAKLKVRTNKKPYEQIARITSGSFAFDDVDFSDFTFSPNGETLFAIQEKEKRWVEKQYYFFSNEYLKPFSLYYVAFRYSIMGRYKG